MYMYVVPFYIKRYYHLFSCLSFSRTLCPLPCLANPSLPTHSCLTFPPFFYHLLFLLVPLHGYFWCLLFPALPSSSSLSNLLLWIISAHKASRLRICVGTGCTAWIWWAGGGGRGEHWSALNRTAPDPQDNPDIKHPWLNVTPDSRTQLTQYAPWLNDTFNSATPLIQRHPLIDDTPVSKKRWPHRPPCLSDVKGPQTPRTRRFTLLSDTRVSWHPLLNDAPCPTDTRSSRHLFHKSLDSKPMTRNTDADVIFFFFVT